jgi:antitoxin YefM
MSMRIASLAEVKAKFSDFVNFCVSKKELVVVTKHGRPAVVMMAVDEEELERLMLLRSPKFRALAEEADKEYRAGNSIPTEDFWKQIDDKESPLEEE